MNNDTNTTASTSSAQTPDTKFLRRIYRFINRSVKGNPWLMTFLGVILFGSQTGRATMVNAVARAEEGWEHLLLFLKQNLYGRALKWILLGTCIYVLANAWWHSYAMAFLGGVLVIAGSIIVYIFGYCAYEIAAYASSKTDDEKKIAKQQLQKALGKARQWAMIFMWFSVMFTPWGDWRLFFGFILSMFILLNLVSSTQRGVEGKGTWARVAENGMITVIVFTFLVLLGRQTAMMMGVPKERLITDKFAGAFVEGLAGFAWMMPTEMKDVGDSYLAHRARDKRADINRDGLVDIADTALSIADINGDDSIGFNDLSTFPLYYPRIVEHVSFDGCDTTLSPCNREWILNATVGVCRQKVGDINADDEVNLRDSVLLYAIVTGAGRPPTYPLDLSVYRPDLLATVHANTTVEEDFEEAQEADENENGGQASPAQNNFGSGAYAAQLPSAEPARTQLKSIEPIRIARSAYALPEQTYLVPAGSEAPTIVGRWDRGDTMVVMALGSASFDGPAYATPRGNPHNRGAQIVGSDFLRFGEIHLVEPAVPGEITHRLSLGWYEVGIDRFNTTIYQAIHICEVSGEYSVGYYDLARAFGDNTGSFTVTVRRNPNIML